MDSPKEFLSWMVIGAIDILISWYGFLVATVIAVAVPRIRSFLSSQVLIVVDHILDVLGRMLGGKLFHWTTMRQFAKNRLLKKYVLMRLATTGDVKLATDDSYITLTLRTADQQRRIDHKSLLTQSDRIRIIGDPGAGKSTILMKIYRDNCRSALKFLSTDHYLPVLLELRNLVPEGNNRDALGQWLLAAARREVTEVKVLKIEETFDIYLHAGKLLIMLDGLDEVPAIRYAAMREAIVGLSATLDKFGISSCSKILLTMREQFHRQFGAAFDDVFSTTCVLNPFDSNDIYAYLQTWPYRNDENVGNSGSGNAVRIYRDLNQKPMIREMCTNPLILSMYVGLDQYPNQNTMPESRTGFYREVVTELAARRRKKQGVTHGDTGLHLEQRLSFLGLLATEHLLALDQPANRVSWRHALAACATVTGLPTKEAEAQIREICVETGLIAEEVEGEALRFLHLSICEYLAGHHAAEKSETVDRLFDVIKYAAPESRTATIERLRNVIPFLCQSAISPMRLGLLNRTLEIGDNDLSARCFLETRYYHSNNWPIFWNDILNSLGETIRSHGEQFLQSPAAVDWLKTLHLVLSLATDSKSASQVPGSKFLIPDIPKTIHSFNLTNEAFQSFLLTYTKVDAMSAFALSQEIHQHGALNLSEVFVQGAVNPIVLDSLVSMSISARGVDEKWLLIVCEAALRYKVVADMLLAKAYPPDLMKYRFQKRSGKFTKIVAPEFRPTMYRACIEFIENDASNFQFEIHTKALRTAILSHGASNFELICFRLNRFSYRSSFSLSSLLFFVTVMLFYFFGINLFYADHNNSNDISVAFALLWFIGILSLFASLYHQVGREIVSLRLRFLNLRSTTKSVTFIFFPEHFWLQKPEPNQGQRMSKKRSRLRELFEIELALSTITVQSVHNIMLNSVRRVFGHLRLFGELKAMEAVRDECTLDTVPHKNAPITTPP